MKYGRLASSFGKKYPIKVLKSYAGFYIGTSEMDEEIGVKIPFTRESVEYYGTFEEAEAALHSGTWTQKATL